MLQVMIYQHICKQSVLCRHGVCLTCFSSYLHFPIYFSQESIVSTGLWKTKIHTHRGSGRYSVAHDFARADIRWCGEGTCCHMSNRDKQNILVLSRALWMSQLPGCPLIFGQLRKLRFSMASNLYTNSGSIIYLQIRAWGYEETHRIPPQQDIMDHGIRDISEHVPMACTLYLCAE